MCRWLISIAFGLTAVASPAEVPDPGEMAVAFSETHPAPTSVQSTAAIEKAAEPSTTPLPTADSDKLTPPLDPSTENVPDDGGFRDTLNQIPAKPAPDVAEPVPRCFDQVEYLRKHHDGVMAISYLRSVVTNKTLLPQDRARAILELADCLAGEHQEAESLCWLKIWTQLYPTRPEFGAVSYRIGAIYTHMGLPDLARDAYYLTLAHSVNEGQVQSEQDLKEYTKLTEGTLWALAANEYEAGQWVRAAELFARYQVEATSASALSQEKAAFLQADCYYQLRQTDKAVNQYVATLQKHPFNALAPEARLRLYHLYTIKGEPQKANEELESLAWTVRTVWPKDETYWQKQTAELLLALNQKNDSVLPPLLEQAAKLSHEGKTWQEALNHYDALVGFEAVKTQGSMDSETNSNRKAQGPHHLREEDDLLALNRSLDQLLPPPAKTSNL